MPTAKWRGDMRAVRPMLATLEDAPLESAGLVYEPKYDGIRALVEIDPGRRAPVRIWSRLGNEKTAQFPDLVAALTRYAKKLHGPLLLDGEIVALDEKGEPAGFQRLQNRIHLTESNSAAAAGRVALIAFDILRDGDDDLRPSPLAERRARLERAFRNTGSPILRLSDVVSGDARELFQHALDHGWEGLIAKEAHSVYHTGKRTRDWRKIKIVHEQEFVVGGWTDSRTTDRPFGALLLGYYEDGGLKYAGHTGSGFNQRELERVMRLLKPLETSAPPFTTRPRTNERPHWTRPEVVVSVGFTEWTDDGVFRHPKYLGVRDDVDLRTVRREPFTPPAVTPSRAPAGGSARAGARVEPWPRAGGATRRIIERLAEIEARGGEGVIELPGEAAALSVGHLDKVFWPASGITKGALMRYYAWAAPYILPAVADRALIMRRFPEGIRGKAFYQQRAPHDAPPGIRVETLPVDREVPSRLIGGSLATLLFMTQVAAISQDPWFSRVRSLDDADHVVLDLDPMPGVPFASVVDVARWIHDELERVGTPSVPKTSGAQGLHVYIPLPPHTSYEAGRLFCELVATLVADRHPAVATTERAVDARGRRVYVDYLQNMRGKTLATAYSARATDDAGVSAPLTWAEVHAGVVRRDFTLRTMPDRLRAVGDLWKALRESPGADLAAILRAPASPSRGTRAARPSRSARPAARGRRRHGP